MATIKEFNRCGEELEKILLLRTSPVAVKMLEKESDIPKGALRPKKDRNIHYAQCQAFALSRRDGTTSRHAQGRPLVPRRPDGFWHGADSPGS